ncbi:MAG: amidohydrolase/deacetylase family metallohydrolase [Acidobacteria bacterium]|nr:amidohydrolase/deacetylase family metallohydrolase [Acidobacteriota bacterium]
MSARLAALLIGVLVTVPALAQTYDILLKGGRVIDPANQIDAVMDVAINGDKIARVAASIPGDQAKRTIDVAGYVVTPGLIDLHAHVFGYPGALWPDDTQLTTGATTVVDCGGSGWRTFDTFKETVIDRTRTRVFSFINVVGKGMVGSDAENDVSDMDPEKTAAKMAEYPDLTVGIKTAHFARKGYTALERAVEAGRLSDKPVIIDMRITTEYDRTTERIFEIMRPGDLRTHSFSDHQVELLDRATRKIHPYAREARKKGLLFDVGHGNGSFVFPVASDAMKDDFPPDTISTDLHNSSIFSTKSDMPDVISKFLNFGMTLPDAIAKSTVRPAQVIRKFPELGTLGAGRVADVAVFKLRRGVFGFTDSKQRRLLGTQKLEAVLTLRAGKLVFDQDGLAFPKWDTVGDYEIIAIP